MRTKPSLVIDAHNIRGGGGKQVAASVLSEMARMHMVPGDTAALEQFSKIDFIVNDDVLSDLSAREIEVLKPKIVPPFPRDILDWRRTATWDACWTVFGPRYTPAPAAVSVVGFADVTAIWPDPVAERAPRLTALRRELRGAVSRFIHSKADHLIVETASTAHQLNRRLATCPPTSVVPNTVHSVFRHPQEWEDIDRLHNLPEGPVYLCYPARGYRHKNHGLLPQVADYCSRAGLEVAFLTTLDSAEIRTLGLAESDALVHLGRISIRQMPTLLKAADGVIFPSLLEAFSASPLEAAIMGKPLFASDRGFVRDVAGPSAHYFDPLSPESTGQSLLKHFGEDLQCPVCIDGAVQSIRGDVIAHSARDRVVQSLNVVAKAAVEEAYHG